MRARQRTWISPRCTRGSFAWFRSIKGSMTAAGRGSCRFPQRSPVRRWRCMNGETTPIAGAGSGGHLSRCEIIARAVVALCETRTVLPEEDGNTGTVLPCDFAGHMPFKAAPAPQDQELGHIGKDDHHVTGKTGLSGWTGQFLNAAINGYGQDQQKARYNQPRFIGHAHQIEAVGYRANDQRPEQRTNHHSAAAK